MRVTKAQPSKIQLVQAIERLLDSLDKQCFPIGEASAERKCDYSLNVSDAMRHARSLIARPAPAPPTDKRDLARPRTALDGDDDA